MVVEIRGVRRMCRVLVGRCGETKETEFRTGPGSARGLMAVGLQANEAS